MKFSRFLLALLCVYGFRSSAAESKPHLVYILADDLGYDEVS